MTIGICHIVAHHESLISLSCDDAAPAARSNYVTYVSRAARWARSIQHTSIIAILTVGSLSGCNPVTLDDAERHPTDAFDRIRSIDLLPRSPGPQEPNANAPDRRQSAIYTDANVIELVSADTRASTKSA